jgi:Domain of unknown function (DUF3883)
VVDKEDPARLSIEVKASTMGLHGSFYLTVNEWERAQDALNHSFHLWDIRNSQHRLSVVSVPQMQAYVPTNHGHGEWQSVRVPFHAFSEWNTFASSD